MGSGASSATPCLAGFFALRCFSLITIWVTPESWAVKLITSLPHWFYTRILRVPKCFPAVGPSLDANSLHNSGVTVLTGILFGLAPGLHASRTSLNDVLKDESRSGTSGGQARLRNALVIAEISISLVLLVSAGLLLRSLHALLRQDPGFNLHNVLAFSVNLPDSAYPSDKTPPYYSAAAARFDLWSRAAQQPWDRKTNARSSR